MRAHGSVLVGAAALGLLACGAEPAQEIAPDGEPLNSTSSEIVNGTQLSDAAAIGAGLVAIYHWDLSLNHWWPRPCSGIVLKTFVDQTYVLTARHCVTQDGTVGGAMFTAPYTNKVRVTYGGAPGIAVQATDPFPNSDPIAASHIFYHSTAPGSRFGDVAVVQLPAVWNALNGKRALFMGDPAGLTGKVITAYGYGINEYDSTCHLTASTTGAGIARSALMSVTGGTKKDNTGNYTIPNGAAGDFSAKRLICGDSGGPDLFYASANWRTLIGVHSLGIEDPALSIAAGPWISQVLEGVYVSPLSYPQENIGITSPGTPWLSLVASPNGTGIAYNRLTQRLYIPGDEEDLCLTWNTNEEGFYFGSCASTSIYSKWEVTGESRIKMVGYDVCMERTTSAAATLRPCKTTTDSRSNRQLWAFHPVR